MKFPELDKSADDKLARYKLERIALEGELDLANRERDELTAALKANHERRADLVVQIHAVIRGAFEIETRAVDGAE